MASPHSGWHTDGFAPTRVAYPWPCHIPGAMPVASHRHAFDRPPCPMRGPSSTQVAVRVHRRSRAVTISRETLETVPAIHGERHHSATSSRKWRSSRIPCPTPVCARKVTAPLHRFPAQTHDTLGHSVAHRRNPRHSRTIRTLRTIPPGRPCPAAGEQHTTHTPDDADPPHRLPPTRTRRRCR